MTLHGRLGQKLSEGVAFDRQGRATRDPAAALAGAFAAWGGAKGSGLGLVVQLLGTLAGSPPIPPELENFGFLVVAVSRSLFGSEEDFRSQPTHYAEAVRAARPVEGGEGPAGRSTTRAPSGAGASRRGRSRLRIRCMRRW